MDPASVHPPLADPLAPSEGAAVPPEHPQVKIEPVPLAEMAVPLVPAPPEQQQSVVYPQLVNPAPSQPTTHHVEVVALSLVNLQKNNPTDEEPEAQAVAGIPQLPSVFPNEHTNDTTIHINSIDGAKRLKSTATKYTMKPKDPKRDTSIPFEEMQRLMRVYGKKH